MRRASSVFVALLSAAVALLLRLPAVGGAGLCAIPAYQLAFPDASALPRGFIMNDGANLTVTQAHKIPTIYMQIQDSFGNQQYDVGPTISVSVSGATADGGLPDPYVRLSSTPVTGFNGLVAFSGIQLERGPQYTDTFRLRFTVSVTNPAITYAISGFVLISPPLTVATTQIDAHHIALYPVESAWTYLGQPLTVVSGSRVRAFRFAVMNSLGTVNTVTSALGAETNYTFVASFATPPRFPTTITGGSASAVRGVATFDSLVITTTAPVGAQLPPLVITCALLCCEAPYSGPITVAPLREYDTLAFASADASAVYYDGQVIPAVNSVYLPLIRVVLKDTAGNPSPSSTGLVFVATIGAASPELTGGVVGLVQGNADFFLKFDRCRDDNQRPYVVTITAGNQYGFVSSETLRFVVLFSQLTFPGYQIRFRASPLYSFFTAEGQAALVTNNQLNIGVGIELLDSSLQVNSTTAGVAVTASLFTTSEGAQAVATQFVVAGRASFPPLILPTTSSSRNPQVVTLLLFSASAPGLPCDGQVLASGRVTLTSEIPAFTIAFESTGTSLFSQAGAPGFATINVAMPTIVLTLLSSAGNVDATASGIGVTASVNGGGLLSNSFVRTANGIATFSQLTFVSDAPGTFVITFTVGADKRTAAAGKSVSTGGVVVVTTVTSNFAPLFVPSSSFVQYVGHVVPVTLGTGVAMPPITLGLADSTHALPGSFIDPTPYAGVSGTVTAIGGAFDPSSTTSVPVSLGYATFNNLSLATGLNAVMMFCVAGGSLPATGACISSGPVSGRFEYVAAAGLALTQIDSTAGGPVALLPGHAGIAATRGAVFAATVAVVDSNGWPVKRNSGIQTTTVVASSVFTLSGTTRRDVNLADGTATFSDLGFSVSIPTGVTPYIVFTIATTAADTAQRLLRPISSGLITVANSAAQALAGTTVVVEVLTDYSTFNPDTWVATLARILNIETQRISVTYVYSGKSGPTGTTFDPVVGNFVQPDWTGVRLEIRLLPPLPNSVDTRTPDELATFVTNFQPGCGGVQSLYLRRAPYLKAVDSSCDWLVFDNQMNGVRSCVQARGIKGYCNCYVPLFDTLGLRCVGLSRLSDLCLNILISSQSAACKNKVIVDTCSLFQYPDAPRDGLAAAGFVMFFLWVVIAYWYGKGYFHGLESEGFVPRMDVARGDSRFEALL